MRGLANAAAVLPKTRFSRQLHHFPEVESTNDVARQMGRAGEPDGTLIVAEAQTAGRGRRRRTWVSPPGAGLYVSLILRPPVAAAESGAAVQLAAGIAVAEALADFLPCPPELRWPNDCYAAGRKIAGILVEAETTGEGLDFLVCGIGVNVNHEAADFPAEVAPHATSLQLQVGHRVERLPVLAALLTAFDTWEAVWRKRGLEPIRARWLELSPQTRAGGVRVQTQQGILEGMADGLTEAGHLRVLAGGRVHEIAVGELVRLGSA